MGFPVLSDVNWYLKGVAFLDGQQLGFKGAVGQKQSGSRLRAEPGERFGDEE